MHLPPQTTADFSSFFCLGWPSISSSLIHSGADVHNLCQPIPETSNIHAVEERKIDE
jgi:hypothetical protein